ncbi:hypothetical protein M426DRAFT_318731 [Hypoxylon sp. CI-4A]|nr:hypothetical protein M426DRAFT_318731 [Hypoxylon sp. CI-4A]
MYFELRTVAMVGLLATSATSKPVKYTIPSNLKLAATNCTYPATYTISNFMSSTDNVDATKNTTSFYFADKDTGISTFCTHNSTSTPTSGSSSEWPCDNPSVSFIYQTTGAAGLTMVELACPGNSPQFEAAGKVQPDLSCTNSTTGSTCVAKQSPITGDFDSFEPAPPTSR